MTIKKIIGFIHLWLGFISGLLGLFLAVTGCILAFEQEIRGFTEPWQKSAVREMPYILPSRLKDIAAFSLDGKQPRSIEYPGEGRSAIAQYYDADSYRIVYLDPYTGATLKAKNMNRDFFRFIIDGHYYLWLPPAIGQPIVASGTLIFVIMMITGLILWWPKNKAARKQRFKVKFSARWRRVNYDMHNVFGFYMTWIAIFVALSGLVMGFQWFARSVYWISSGGNATVVVNQPVSDTTKGPVAFNMVDRLAQQHWPEVKPDESLSVFFPALPTDVIEVIVNHRPGTYYKTDAYHYDQFTGKELPAKGSYDGKYKQASVADKLVRMNYDLHVGALFGLTGKILVFFASLLAGSLPVTGFIIWWGRRKKKRKQVGQQSPAVQM